MKYNLSPEIKLDLQRLVETRLLITASSGGGKSMTIRTLLETTHGVFPHIILDVEGEFSTLREKYDYILAGKNGDIPVESRTAGMLARKLLELNASCIIDLYELRHTDKHHFVKLFVDALVESPKELWGPRLLVIDEAHQFCPEKGAGSSEAWESIIDVCEKGRKRGLGAVLATQRLSKLNKDAAAECQNKIIGLANIDIDRERSAKELGFTHKEDVLSLRDLEAGEFFVIGPALSKTVQKTRISLATTSHPKIGKRTVKAPMATAKVKHLLEKLKDLPQEAAKELKTQADMLAEINRLKAELRKVPAPVVEKVDTEKIYQKAYEECSKAFMLEAGKWVREHVEMIKSFQLKAFAHTFTPPGRPPITMTTHPPITQLKPPTAKALQEVALKVAARPAVPESELKVGSRQKEILRYLCLFPDKPYKLASMALSIGSPNNGTFSNLCTDLANQGLITRQDGKIQIAAYDEAVRILGPDFKPRKGTLAEFWSEKLKGRPKLIYTQLLENHSTTFKLADLAASIGSPNNGTFSNLCTALSNQGVAIRDNGTMKLNPEILELG